MSFNNNETTHFSKKLFINFTFPSRLSLFFLIVLMLNIKTGLAILKLEMKTVVCETRGIFHSKLYENSLNLFRHTLDLHII